jgi:hydroxypyruvate isomerase
MSVQYTANLSMLFTEMPFEERFAAASAAGFRHVEFMFPYAYDVALLQNLLIDNNLRVELFNLPPGDFAAGDRGLLADPARRDEFHRALDQALEYAAALGCPRLHAMLGNQPEGVSDEALRATLVANLAYAAPLAASAGVMLTIEALNPLDFPHFCLCHSADAFAIMAEVNQPNLKFQFDCYHLQISEGNLTYTFRSHVHDIGHVQIADVPGRHEPGTGEINYPFLLLAIGETDYDGFVGLEFIPSRSTRGSLAWLPRGARSEFPGIEVEE